MPWFKYETTDFHWSFLNWDTDHLWKKWQQDYFLELKVNLYWIVPQTMNYTVYLNKSIV